MTLSDRERFIYYQAIMMSSERAKSLDNKTKMEILDYLRKTNCKSVTDEIWREIKFDLDKETDKAMETMFKGVFRSIGGSFNIKELFKKLNPKATEDQIKNISEIGEKALANASDAEIADALKAFSGKEQDPEMTKKLVEQLKKDRPDLKFEEK